METSVLQVARAIIVLQLLEVSLNFLRVAEAINRTTEGCLPWSPDQSRRNHFSQIFYSMFLQLQCDSAYGSSSPDIGSPFGLYCLIWL